MTYEELKAVRENPALNDVENEEISRLIDSAIDKQIAKRMHKHYTYIGYCDCGRLIFSDMRYCPECGQKIDWRGVNETKTNRSHN